MSIAELKTEIDISSLEDIQQLKVYLAVRQDLLDPEFRREMAQKIDDKNPANWIPLDEAEKRLFPL